MEETPILFLNAKDEDIEARRLVLGSGIACELRFAAEEPTPLLLVGYQRFEGVAEISEYVEKRVGVEGEQVGR